MGAKCPLYLMKNLKFLKSTIQVLIAMYPFCATIFTNNPDFYASDFALSVVFIASLELSYRLICYIQG
jgi:hypothetical protein